MDFKFINKENLQKLSQNSKEQLYRETKRAVLNYDKESKKILLYKYAIHATAIVLIVALTVLIPFIAADHFSSGGENGIYNSGNDNYTTLTPQASSQQPIETSPKPDGFESEPGAPLKIGVRYASIDDIPIARTCDTYFEEPLPRSVSDMFLIDNVMYFTIGTHYGREAGNVWEIRVYKTLFKFDPENGSCIVVSDKVSYIDYIESSRSFIYTKGDEYNDDAIGFRPKIAFYTNNIEWNDEEKIRLSTYDAMVMAENGRYATIDGRRSVYALNINLSGYAVSYNLDTEIVVTLAENNRQYKLKPDFSSIIKPGDKATGFDVYGVDNDKIYIGVNFDVGDVYQSELCVVPLSGGKAKLIQYNGGKIFSNFPGSFSNDSMFAMSKTSEGNTLFLKIDTRTDEVIKLESIEGNSFWGEFIYDGQYVFYAGNNVEHKSWNDTYRYMDIFDYIKVER